MSFSNSETKLSYVHLPSDISNMWSVPFLTPSCMAVKYVTFKSLFDGYINVKFMMLQQLLASLIRWEFLALHEAISNAIKKRGICIELMRRTCIVGSNLKWYKMRSLCIVQSNFKWYKIMSLRFGLALHEILWNIRMRSFFLRSLCKWFFF